MCVIFSDEMKFNLDGPDGWVYYWHDLRRDEEIFSKKQQGGKSFMVWGGFGYGGKASLAFPTGRMYAIHYQTLLEEYLIPVAERIGTENWIFQQDKGVHGMEWPAISPDLNPMENVWGLLS